MATFNFATAQPTAPATNIQWNAINNAANNKNLVSQLYAGKTPTATTPAATASAANVKNPNAPQTNPFSTPASTAANAVGSGILSSLSANTKPFSPSTLATGNTPGASWATPAATPQTPELPGLGGGAVPLNIPTNNQNTATVAPVNNTPPQTTAVATSPVPASAPTPTPTPTPTTTSGTPITTGGLLGAAGTAAQGEQQIEQEEEAIKNNYSNRIAGLLPQINSEAGDLTTGTTPVATGNAAIAAQTATAETGQLQTAETAALNPLEAEQTAQAAETTGLNTAAQTSVGTPAAYGQTVFNPVTGEYTGGSSGVSPTDPFYPTMQQYASLAANGNYNSIPASITGNAVLNAQLIQMAQQINPSFNPTLAQSSATTQATGQQLQTQVSATTQALGTLQGFFSQLAPFQTQGIPLTNEITQSLGQALGSGAVAQYQTALTEARSQVIGTLTTTGMTPTDAQSAAETYLPDGMTAQQLQTNIAALTKFMQQKVNAYTQSGTNNSGPTATNSNDPLGLGI